MATTYNPVNNITINTAGGIAGSGAGGGSTVTVTGAGSGYTLSGAGVAGSYLTTNGTTYSTSWTSPNTNFTSSNGKAVMTMPYGEDKVILEEKAALEVKGKVIMNGMDLDERLKTIEKVLCIPQRDVTMEAKHPKLKKLYEQYMHELEKYKTWDRVKGDE